MSCVCISMGKVQYKKMCTSYSSQHRTFLKSTYVQQYSNTAMPSRYLAGGSILAGAFIGFASRGSTATGFQTATGNSKMRWSQDQGDQMNINRGLCLSRLSHSSLRLWILPQVTPHTHTPTVFHFHCITPHSSFPWPPLLLHLCRHPRHDIRQNSCLQYEVLPVR